MDTKREKNRITLRYRAALTLLGILILIAYSVFQYSLTKEKHFHSRMLLALNQRLLGEKLLRLSSESFSSTLLQESAVNRERVRLVLDDFREGQLLLSSGEPSQGITKPSSTGEIDLFKNLNPVVQEIAHIANCILHPKESCETSRSKNITQLEKAGAIFDNGMNDLVTLYLKQTNERKKLLIVLETVLAIGGIAILLYATFRIQRPTAVLFEHLEHSRNLLKQKLDQGTNLNKDKKSRAASPPVNLKKLNEDLKFPLQSIPEYLEIMTEALEEKGSDEHVLHLQRMIRDSVNSALRIIDQRLEAPAARQEEHQLEATTFDFISEMKDLIQTYHPIALSMNTKLFLSAPNMPVFMWGNKAIIRKSIGDLLSTAIQDGKGSELIVKVRMTISTVELKIGGTRSDLRLVLPTKSYRYFSQDGQQTGGA